MDKCDDQRPASATRRGSVPKLKDGKPWKAGEVEAGAKELVADEGLGWKVYEGSGLGEDSCAGAYPKAKACMLFDQHRKFGRCDLDLSVLGAAKPDLFLTVSSQKLNPNSEVTEGEMVKVAAQRLQKKAAAVWACRKASAWEVLLGLDATQGMPEHILHFSLYAVRKVSAVREVPPHFARRVVFDVKEPIALDGS